jgi:hypothetical protein
LRQRIDIDARHDNLPASTIYPDANALSRSRAIMVKPKKLKRGKRALAVFFTSC